MLVLQALVDAEQVLTAAQKRPGSLEGWQLVWAGMHRGGGVVVPGQRQLLASVSFENVAEQQRKLVWETFVERRAACASTMEVGREVVVGGSPL